MPLPFKTTFLAVCILAATGAALANEPPALEPTEDAVDLREEGPSVTFTCEATDLSPRAESAAECKRKCNKKCDGASNKSKCVGTCRRACDG